MVRVGGSKGENLQSLLPDYRTLSLEPDYRTTGLPDYRTTGLPDYRTLSIELELEL